MELLIVWVLSAVALIVTAYLVPGFEVRNFGAALLGALVLGLANAVLWPLLIILTLPINILTLGLFTFVISAAMLKLAAAVVRDLKIDGWGPALLGALVLAVVNTILRVVL
jgi:putative membrane protein